MGTVGVDTEQMAKRMKIRKEVAFQLDTLTSEAERFGVAASLAFGRDRGKAQLRNLQNIANSTLKVSDVFDYIKRQTARMWEWRKEVTIETEQKANPLTVRFGPDILAFFKTKSGILENRKRIVDKLAIADPFVQQEMYLDLMRDFIKQLVIHFEWDLEEKSYGRSHH